MSFKKFLFFTGLVVLTSTCAFAQKSKKVNHRLIDSSLVVKKFHTLEELNSLDKFKLIDLYKERISAILNVLPYIGLTNKPGQTLKMIGIPETSDNLAYLADEVNSKNALIHNTDILLSAYLPYADKLDLAWAIIVYEEMLKRVSLGKDY